MEIMPKLVDVICPVYNKAELVVDFINSFIKFLDVENFNLIIVDDGSTDNLKEKIINIISPYENIYLLRKDNGGVSTARNYGFKYSSSKYVWFCDPDDLIAKDSNYLLAELTKHNCDVYVFGYNIFDVQKRRITETFSFSSEKEVKSTDYLINYDYFQNKNGISTIWNKIYNRNILEQVKFNELLSNAEDRVFNIEVLMLNVNCYLSTIIIYQHNRYKDGTLSTTRNIKKIDDLRYANDFNIKALSKFKNVDFEKKKNVIIICSEMLSLGKINMLKEYIYEHKRININIMPFISSKELIFFIPYASFFYNQLRRVYHKYKAP
ncbi:glycosyltransferase family 2 protein [Klebsiella pneumoniae]|uniref:glycosyltransferase family 2 protein n=1 Tax=Klebsiella pneumoniae TaxID=573 RepID=UPI003870FC8F